MNPFAGRGKNLPHFQQTYITLNHFTFPNGLVSQHPTASLWPKRLYFIYNKLIFYKFKKRQARIDARLY